MKFSEYSTRWKRDILKLKKPATVATMTSHLKLLEAAFGETDLRRLDYPTVQAYFTAVAAQRSPKSVKNLWATLRVVLKQAQAEGKLKDFPKPVLPKVTRGRKRWFSLAELASVIRTDPDRKALWWTLYETGARIGEVLALEVTDVLDTGALSITKTVYAGKVQSSPKTESSNRTIALSGHLFSMLVVEQADRKKGFLFPNRNGKPIAMNDLLVRRLHPALVANGIEPCGFHAFRRGSISTALSVLGVPLSVVQARVGHGGEGMTLGVYSQAISEADHDAANKMGAAIETALFS